MAIIYNEFGDVVGSNSNRNLEAIADSRETTMNLASAGKARKLLAYFIELLPRHLALRVIHYLNK